MPDFVKPEVESLIGLDRYFFGILLNVQRVENTGCYFVRSNCLIYMIITALVISFTHIKYVLP